MKRQLFNVLAVLSCCVFLMGVFADLTGRWKGVIKTPDGNEIQAAYNFKVEGDKLSGTAESPEGTVIIDSGRVAGNNFSFQVTVDGNNYMHKGTFYGDSCGVDIDFGGQIVHSTLLRDTTVK